MKKTVIVRLHGGLGNQMFQYACGRAVANRRNANLLIDLRLLLDRSPRENYVYRNYELNVFQIKQDFASLRDIMRVGLGLRQQVSAKLFGRPPQWKYRAFEELPGPLQDELLNGNGSVYLDGFWQSAKYFAEIDDLIRREFQLWFPPTGRADELRRKIAAGNSVCINARRTDFVGQPINGTCEDSYFMDAFNYVHDRVDNPNYFVFSDDLVWCREHFAFIHNATFVEFADVEGRMEWYQNLMQTCRHFIIPNSTFAWWAAYLSQFPERIVVAPKQWFAISDLNKFSDEIIPPDWVRL